MKSLLLRIRMARGYETLLSGVVTRFDWPYSTVSFVRLTVGQTQGPLVQEPLDAVPLVIPEIPYAADYHRYSKSNNGPQGK